MLRRLYFLFPDENHAQVVVDQLVQRNIPKYRMHAIAHGVEISSLPQATERQKNDTVSQLDQFVWKINLTLFAVALVLFVAAIFAAEWFWSVVLFAVMLISFFAGKYFVERMPHDHLKDFTGALAHGEILLMVDVPVYRVESTTRFIEHHHPEATLDGASWTLDAFGI